MKIVQGNNKSKTTQFLIDESNKCENNDTLFFSTLNYEYTLKEKMNLNCNTKMWFSEDLTWWFLSIMIKDHKRKNNAYPKKVFIDGLFLSSRITCIDKEDTSLDILQKINKIERVFDCEVIFTCEHWLDVDRVRYSTHNKLEIIEFKEEQKRSVAFLEKIKNKIDKLIVLLDRK